MGKTTSFSSRKLVKDGCRVKNEVIAVKNRSQCLMDKTKVIKQLKKKFPNKNIIALPIENPTEILCEIDPTSDHQEYSVAISVIDKSKAHYHKSATETYKVIKGNLNLIINGISHNLKEGSIFVISPNSIHYSIGDEAWVECRSEPGWRPEDHILIN